MKKWFAICKPLGRERKMEKELEFLENDIVQRLLKSNEEVMKRLIATSNQSLTKKVSRGQRAKVAIVDEVIGNDDYKKEIVERVLNTNIFCGKGYGCGRI